MSKILKGCLLALGLICFQASTVSAKVDAAMKADCKNSAIAECEKSCPSSCEKHKNEARKKKCVTACPKKCKGYWNKHAAQVRKSMKKCIHEKKAAAMPAKK